MREFAYHLPKSLAEAAQLLSANPEAKLIAGGMTLIPTMKQRLATPTDLIDLGGVGGLVGIQATEREVVIGAMTTHAAVAASADVARRIPALATLAGGIGDPQVRHRGTIGGSISNNDPAADYPAGLVALAATVVTDKRSIAADDFFTGMFETALELGEIVKEVRFRVPERAAYMKFPNPASRYAVAGVFVARHTDGIRVAVTGAAPVVFRVPEMERALAARFEPAAIESIRVPADGLNSDLHASAEYRSHLVTVMARRAVAACL
ncbi:MAG TPA: xanthine dehydrogenase family protein subunit M [Alphaproteobacteria bacterium]|nr:xanthine dehydrogenase family protein subunit M [Alphaproteobacteria bacterium]